jgi:hypothetical protein
LRIELPAGVPADLILPRLGWSSERLAVNGLVVWQADPAAPFDGRTVEHALGDGGTYEIELRIV